MIINTIQTSNCTPQTIVIGRRGTYDTMQIAFDLSFLIKNYGSGTAVLAIKRSQDESAYPAIITQEDATLLWTVNETDTAYVGSGECQLMWYVDGGLAKTIIYPMVVMRDILQTAEQPPDGYENWVESLTKLGAETLQNAQEAAQSASDAEAAKDDAVAAKEAAEEAAETAQEAVVHAPIIQNGYWYIWNDDQYVDTGVRAEGQKGDKGDTGEKGDTGNGIASIAKTGTSGLVDTYTVTYTDGTTTTFTVTNGAKGDKGDTGATGNGIQSITKTGTSGNVDTYTITYTNGQTTTFTVTNGAVSSVNGKTGAVNLASGDIAYDESATYQAGSVGAELSDLTRQLSDVESALTNVENIDFVEAASRNGAINSSNQWSTSSGMTSYYFTVVAGYKQLSVTASESATTIIGLLKNGTLTSGKTPPYCTGISGRIVLTAGESQTLTIPDDCTYIVITKTTLDSVDHTPAYGQFGILKNIPAIDRTLTVSGDAADAKAVGEAISLHNNLFDSADPTVLPLFIRTSTNTFSTASDNRLVVVTVSKNTNYYIKCGGASTKRICFSNVYPVNGGRLTVVGNDITGYVDILANSGDNTYLCVQLFIDSDDDKIADHYYTGIMIESKNVVNYLDNKIDSLTNGIPLGLHEMPENTGVLNVIKRCRQLTDIEWTPAVDLPRFMRVWRGWGAGVPSTAVPEDHTGTFKAGVKYKGIPYGRPKASISSRYGKSNTFVGRDIDLGTFVTAVSCNKSIVSVEKNSGTIGSDHFSIPYCDVCSALTCYALNTVGYYATESIGNIPGLNLIGKINDNGVLINADNFKLGDVLNEPGSHTAIVTDIIKDGNGNATVIELCDAAANGLANMSYDDGQIGGVARRKGWTIAEIYDDWGAYDLLRYANIATVPYTMSPYVNVGDEPEMMPVVHYPCLPYEGNNFTYKVGYVPNNAVKVLVMEQGYNYLKVFKDDVEVSGSPFAVTSGTESIDVTEISAGSYKAYLCNLSDGNVRTMTYPCHWTIVT